MGGNEVGGEGGMMKMGEEGGEEREGVCWEGEEGWKKGVECGWG